MKTVRRKIASLVTIVLLVAGSSPAAPPEKLHVFYGEVRSVDLTNKTFSLKSGGRTLVFHYNEQTKIGSFNGHVSWDKVRIGQGAAVAMRLGEGNIGIAVMVRFDDNTGGAKAFSGVVARTTNGQTISGLAVADYIEEAPPGETISRATGFGTSRGNNSDGVFVLSIKPDGSVGNVTAAKSLSTAEANDRVGQWLRKWRFKPNSVTQVQIPVGMRRTWR
jgi:hypothetical protein